jgi:hypothetical protein
MTMRTIGGGRAPVAGDKAMISASSRAARLVLACLLCAVLLTGIGLLIDRCVGPQ